jgi:hypothetical protein
MDPLIAAGLGVLLGATGATAAWRQRQRAQRLAGAVDVHDRVQDLAVQMTGEESQNTEEALEALSAGIAALKGDTDRLLDTIALQSRKVLQLEQGDETREQVLTATRQAMQRHVSRLSQERDGLVARMDRLTSFASGGLEYSEPMPSIVGVDLDEMPTDPPDLPFDLRGGGANRGRA